MHFHLNFAQHLEKLQQSGTLFSELFRHGSLAVELYQPKNVDLQEPHDRDEVYFVARGTGKFECLGEMNRFVAGDLLFVPAFAPHRFFDFSEDFATWVLFWGPTGGEAPHDNNVQISEWQPAFRNMFFQLNKQWIEVDYPLEPLDMAVLSDPETHILAGGGRIFSALMHGMVVGVVALRMLPDGEVELTKMAVDTRFRGKGIGEKLMQAALDAGKAMGVHRLILYSNSITSAAAVRLYRRMGWRALPLETGMYKRANIKMEFVFQ